MDLHNPTFEELELVVRSPLFGCALTVKVAPGSSQSLKFPLSEWNDRRVTIFTDALADQIKRRKIGFGK